LSNFLVNPYRFVSAVPSVIFSEDQDGVSGYTAYHTETTNLPVSGDTYYLGTNNNGYGGSMSSASPSWDTGTSSGTWTVSGESTYKSETTWNDDYIFGKSALGSANQTATDIMMSNMNSASWVGFVRLSDVEVAKTDEAVPQFALALDNGGAVRSIVEGVLGSHGIFPNWSTSSKFKIEILVDV
jgi:hypothetical protein